MPETVVIIGASWSGLYSAHIILKTLPSSAGSKLILINPTTTFFWNVGTPRLLTNDLFKPSELFIDLLPGFDQYPAGSFEFVHGTASAITHANNTVSVQTKEGQKEVTYTQLIIASGSSGHGTVPWKNSSHLDVPTEINTYKAKIAAANSVVISGGGPTAIETAGDLATENPNKKVIVVAGEKRLLPGIPASAGAEAERQLKALGVEVIKGVRVEGETETGVKLSDGRIVEAEFYLPAHGLVPNNAFIPKEWQTSAGWLDTDEYLHVRGTTNVWGVGDIVATSFRNITSVVETTMYVGGAVKKILAGTWKGEKEAQFAWSIAGKPVCLVPIGKNGGTGYLFYFKVWSWLVWYLKSRDFMIGKLSSVVEGKVNTLGGKL